MNVDITKSLRNWRDGDPDSIDEVLPIVYEELYRIAQRYRSKEFHNHTLQTTEIINEAYIKLTKQKNTDWKDRAHFFAFASTIMRNLLVDYARTKKYKKRGGDAKKLSIDEVLLVGSEPDERILALDEALKRLSEFDERKSKIVELKYFGGLSSREVADVISVSEITVKREWLKAKAWLYSEISST